MRRSDHAGSMKPRRGRSRSAGHFGAKIIVTDHGPFRVVGDVAICNPEGTLLRHSAATKAPVGEVCLLRRRAPKWRTRRGGCVAGIGWSGRLPALVR
jgi:hypothetical protein